MLIVIFFMFWGSMLSIILCSPYSYYPLLLLMIMSSFVMAYIVRKFLRSKKTYLYIISILAFIISYLCFTYVIFKEPNINYPTNINVSNNKKAVIFFCEGEMEKYTPYYTSYFSAQTPLIEKPFKSCIIKKYYKDMGLNEKNKCLSIIASQVKSSLLNNGPYYFYIAFSGYTPDIKSSIIQSISDGCSDITVINYSNDALLVENAKKIIDVEKFKKLGVTINFTQPITDDDNFAKMFLRKITNMSNTWDGILIIDSNSCGNKLKAGLVSLNYKENQIIVSNNIDKSLKEFSDMKFKNILYVDITQSSSGIESEIVVPRKMNKYSNNLKITGLKSWGNEKELIKCTLDTFLKSQK